MSITDWIRRHLGEAEEPTPEQKREARDRKRQRQQGAEEAQRARLQRTRARAAVVEQIEKTGVYWPPSRRGGRSPFFFWEY